MLLQLPAAEHVHQDLHNCTPVLDNSRVAFDWKRGARICGMATPVGRYGLGGLGEVIQGG